MAELGLGRLCKCFTLEGSAPVFASSAAGSELGRHSANLADGGTVLVCYPDASTVEQDADRIEADGKCAQVGAVVRLQRDNAIVEKVRDPDPPAVKGDAPRTVPDWQGALDCGVAGADHGDGVI